MMNRHHKGFSLLEVMLVLVLLGGVATLAIGVLPAPLRCSSMRIGFTPCCSGPLNAPCWRVRCTGWRSPGANGNW